MKNRTKEKEMERNEIRIIKEDTMAQNKMI